MCRKNGGYNMEHPYSRDPNASKVFYLLLQIAHMIFQLMEKGSLFRKNFPKGVGSQKTLPSACWKHGVICESMQISFHRWEKDVAKFALILLEK